MIKGASPHLGLNHYLMIKGVSPHLGLDNPKEENLWTLAHWGVENVHDLFIVTLLGQLKQRLDQAQ